MIINHLISLTMIIILITLFLFITTFLTIKIIIQVLHQFIAFTILLITNITNPFLLILTSTYEFSSSSLSKIKFLIIYPPPFP
jgi:uncharacterized membrane protein